MCRRLAQEQIVKDARDRMPHATASLAGPCTPPRPLSWDCMPRASFDHRNDRVRQATPQDSRMAPDGRNVCIALAQCAGVSSISNGRCDATWGIQPEFENNGQDLLVPHGSLAAPTPPPEKWEPQCPWPWHVGAPSGCPECPRRRLRTICTCS